MNVEPRDIALQHLYEAEQRKADHVDIDNVSTKANRIIRGVLEHKATLDRSIEEASEHWSLERMPPVDRTVLRIGLYELRYERDVPQAVIVSEAVRLAKTYSTERSGAFVNGVLGHLARAERSTEE
ncbi:MAG: transcription antitermination factor NusB [Acidimicrobiia bacterium]|nr:transcription antitermination factor NusB [Acidimicrobiia bacterium]